MSVQVALREITFFRVRFNKEISTASNGTKLWGCLDTCFLKIYKVYSKFYRVAFEKVAINLIKIGEKHVSKHPQSLVQFDAVNIFLLERIFRVRTPKTLMCTQIYPSCTICSTVTYMFSPKNNIYITCLYVLFMHVFTYRPYLGHHATIGRQNNVL